MKRKDLELRWDEKSIRGYTDVLPGTLFEASADGADVYHDVRGPRGGRYGQAKCRIVVRPTFVTLDYQRFGRFNREQAMALGVFRIYFTDETRTIFRRATWKNRGSHLFRRADVAAVDKKSGVRPQSTQAVYEGAVRRMTRDTFVRDPRARRQCIDHYGSACFICGFNFKNTYGDIAIDFIHVHHLRPLARGRRRHRVQPLRSLRPVCPNCHAVIHLKSPEYTVERVKRFLVTAKRRHAG